MPFLFYILYAAKEEAALLKKENAKLLYRVNHLVKALNEEEKKGEKQTVVARPVEEKKKSFFGLF